MKISEILGAWYKKNKRNLPWRETRNPYLIWISEIILQQTQVKQGLDYYSRFTERFPDLNSLSEASEEEVLRLWQGLGYYSRARNLLYTARYVSSDLNSKFPDNYEGLRSLKGVGDYTAAAIASIGFNEPVAAVDGNVSRVLSRFFGIEIPIDSQEGKKLIKQLANDNLDKNQPGNSNEAIMEFGALQCKPANPDCSRCPLSAACEANLKGKVSMIPVKSLKLIQRKRWFYFFLFIKENMVAIQKREKDDIWKSLYQFPLFEATAPLEEEEIIIRMNQLWNNEIPEFVLRIVKGPVNHQLTHQKIVARFISIEITGKIKTLPDNWKMIPWGELDKYPFPRLLENYVLERQEEWVPSL